jgi:hypothetical protein
MEFCKRLLPCGEGRLARHSDPSGKNKAGGPHCDPVLTKNEVFASVGGLDFAGGPSSNSSAVLSHPRIPEPAEKEVATSGFGVVGIVLEPLVLLNHLASGPSQNSSANLSLPRIPDLVEKEVFASSFGDMGMTCSLLEAHSPMAELPVIPK